MNFLKKLWALGMNENESTQQVETKSAKEQLLEQHRKQERIQKLIDDPDINCHQGWHQSVLMSEEESLRIHRKRIIQFGYSNRSSATSIDNKVQIQDTNSSSRDQRIETLLADPTLNCHQGWHQSIAMTDEESLQIHEKRYEKFGYSIRKKEKALKPDKPSLRNSSKIDELLNNPLMNCSHFVEWQDGCITKEEGKVIHEFRLNAYGISFLCFSKDHIESVSPYELSKARRWVRLNYEIVSKNFKTIVMEHRLSDYTDSYGNIVNDQWQFSKKFAEMNAQDLLKCHPSEFNKSKIAYFFYSTLVANAGGLDKWVEDWLNYSHIINIIHLDDTVFLFDYGSDEWSRFVDFILIDAKYEAEKERVHSNQSMTSNQDVNGQYNAAVSFGHDTHFSIPDGFTPGNMTGHQYEEFIASRLCNFGWYAETTKGSGDQGVDVLAYIDDKTVCIQCKNWANKATNKAVQEVFAGKLHYRGTHAVVVSRSGFTQGAIDLARSTGVLLITGDKLNELKSFLELAG